MEPVQVFLIVSFGLLLLSIFLVILYKRFSSYSRPLLYFSFINVIGIAALYIELGQFPQLWKTAHILVYAFISFMPFTWYVLSSCWAQDKNEFESKHRLFPRLLFYLAVLIFVIMIWQKAVDVVIIGDRWFIDFPKWRFFINLNLIICLTAGAYAIENRYRSSLGLSRERIKKSFYLLLTYVINFLALATIAIIYGQISDYLLALNFFLAGLICLFYVRHVIRFEPENDGIIISRKASYSSIVVVIFGLYFLVIGLTGEILRKLNLNEGAFFTVVALILIVSTFIVFFYSQARRSRLTGLTDGSGHISSGRKYDVEWKEFAEEISATIEYDEIYLRTKRLLHRIMKIEDSFFILKESEPGRDYRLLVGDDIDRIIPEKNLNQLCDWLHRLGRPIEVSDVKDVGEMELNQYQELERLIPFNVFLLVPFAARHQFIGMWGIGLHNSGRKLLSDEIGFVEAAAGPVALTLHGARITEELVTSREIESYHRFSSFVLHDLKNSVGMLSMLLQNADKNIANPDFQKEALVTIGRAVDRQKKIISRLTEDRGEDKYFIKETNLAELIKSATERVRIDTIPQVDLNCEIDDNVTVFVDPEKIGSVFDNLIMNAVEAMPEGGILSINIVSEVDSEAIGIKFSDSGCGMDADFINSKLFRPFSSTKKHGLGIGMYQSREVILKHGGRMEVKSEIGRGTDFIIYLPGER
ncbi:MAG: ATP-binding protein [candidate division Zixibacteria bacterium]